MTEKPDYFQIAREYQKESQLLLISIPAAMLVYSLDKVGIIGFDHFWMWSTWLAWLALAVASVASVGRMLLIPWLYFQLGISTSVVGMDGAEAGRKHRKYEPWNRILQWAQLVCIAIGFFGLLVAHVGRSIAEGAPALPAKAPVSAVSTTSP